MKRPDNPIVDRLEAAISRLHVAERNVAEAKDRLGSEARAISELTGKQDRIDIAIYAYWHFPNIAVSDLAFGATGKDHPAHLHKLMGPVAAGIECDRCGNQVPITSRSQMQELQGRMQLDQVSWRRGYRVVCPECERTINEEHRVKSQARDAANAERYAQLRAMPYADYLETPDWAVSLQDHVEFARWEVKSNHLVCGACGSEDAIGAYHKRADRLGHEWSADLIILGQSCLTVFVANEIIFGQPSPRHLISNCRQSNYEDY